MDLQTMGRFVAVFGIALVVTGGLLWLAGRLGIGDLPGNLRFGGEGWTCFVPITASILISLVLTVVINILLRLLAK